MTQDNYTPVVVSITSLRPHSNADRLVCTNIFGNNVIVGKETQIGDKGIYFPLESQIDATFAVNNDLIRRKDANGKPAGGMFDENRRVRCQKFRGEKSEGFWIPIQSADYLRADNIVYDGDITRDGDHLPSLATKYIPAYQKSSGGASKKGARQPRESKMIENQFRFHADTAQLGRNIHKINPDDVVVITWKVHGTSSIVSNCLTKRSLSPLDKLLRWFGASIKDTHYEYVYASRRVIKNEFQETKQHYYGEDLWSVVGKRYFEGKLHTGETVYFEIVGFTEAGAPIQKGFDYGCDPSGIGVKNKVFVYRITQTAVDGTVVELQWNQVKERCKQLDVQTVPEIFYGVADITYTPKALTIDIATLPHDITPEILTKLIAQGFLPTGSIGQTVEEWRDSFLAYLKQKYVHDQDSIFCANKVPEEGICVRREGLEIETFKLKSFRFLEFESKALDTGEVDLETQETVDV